MIERALAARNGARHRMVDHIANRIVFEKAAGIGFEHYCAPNFMSGV